MSGTTAVKVSVIVPVYNAKKTIRDCLEAIVGQTLKEIEVICVDDGSKDGSWKVIEEIRQKDDRVRLIRQENQGAGVARNVGMKEARGDYLVFLDSDDYFEPDMLRSAWECCRKTGAEACAWAADAVHIETGESVPYRSAFDKRYILKTNPFDPASDEAHEIVMQMFNGVPWTKMFSRELIQRTGLQFQALRTTNDSFFIYSALVRARRIVTLDRVLVHRRKGIASSLTQTREKSWQCFFQAYAAIRDRLEEDGLFERFERTYMNRLMKTLLWQVESISPEGAEKMVAYLREEGFEKLGLDRYEPEYYYDHLYEGYTWLKELEPAGFRTAMRVARKRDELAGILEQFRNRKIVKILDKLAALRK